MSKIEEQNSGKKEGEIRYLTPLNIDTSVQKKYCRFFDQESSILIIKTLISY